MSIILRSFLALPHYPSAGDVAIAIDNETNKCLVYDLYSENRWSENKFSLSDPQDPETMDVRVLHCILESIYAKLDTWRSDMFPEEVTETCRCSAAIKNALDAVLEKQKSIISKDFSLSDQERKERSRFI